MYLERPALATIEEKVEGDKVGIEVTLAFGGRAFIGASNGEADHVHRPRLVGEATLRAVELVSGGRLQFDLAAVGTTDLGPARIALAQVHEQGWSDYLIGSALIRQNDPSSATAKAILDAVNRRVVKAM
jgi:hypothetical protein